MQPYSFRYVLLYTIQPYICMLFIAGFYIDWVLLSFCFCFIINKLFYTHIFITVKLLQTSHHWDKRKWPVYRGGWFCEKYQCILRVVSIYVFYNPTCQFVGWGIFNANSKLRAFYYISMLASFVNDFILQTVLSTK